MSKDTGTDLEIDLDSVLDVELVKQGVSDADSIKKSLELFVVQKFKQMIEEQGKQNATPGMSDRSTTTVTSGERIVRPSPPVTANPSKNMSFGSVGSPENSELPELDKMKKMLEARISALRVNSSSGSECASNSQYTDIMHKAQQGTLSTQPQSTCANISVAETVCQEKQVFQQKTVEVHKEMPLLAPPAQPLSTALSSGEWTNDALNRRIMCILHDIHGTKNLYDHLHKKLIEAIAKEEYMDFAKHLKDDDEESQATQMVTQNDITVYIPGTKTATESGHIWSLVSSFRGVSECLSSVSSQNDG